ncbi:hypothetical protein FA13DRAFT_1747531, partial [Coprinellus micaceus]
QTPPGTIPSTHRWSRRARVEIPHATLRLIGSPRTPESTSLSFEWTTLTTSPFRFDGSFRSNNPVLEQDDLVLQVVYSDTGASVGVLDDRIIPSRPVLSNFWP